MAIPTWIKQAAIQDAWKTAPVAWETCWDMRKWVNEGWSLRYIFNYALACHGSYINNKSAPLPEGENVRPEIERFLRRLGYRLVLKELKHPPRCKAGGKLELSMKWQNVGSAPCYRPYRVAYRLSNDNGFSQDVRRRRRPSIAGFLARSSCSPTSSSRSRRTCRLGTSLTCQTAIALPADLAAGAYTLVHRHRGWRPCDSRCETGDQGACGRRLVSAE